MPRLRTTLETPDVYDLDADGNPIYPKEDDGTTGGVFTYNASHQGDAPPVPIKEPKRWWQFDKDDLAKAAAATAIILKGAADKQHRRERKAADVQNQRLDAAATLTLEQQAKDAQAAQTRLQAVDAPSIVPEGAPLPQDRLTQISRPGGAPQNGAQQSGVAPVSPQDPYVRELAFEDSTNWSLHGQYEYGGDPAQAPTGNVLNDASGPLPIGFNDAVHGVENGSGEVNHEDMAQRAGFARIQQRGVAEAAEDRRMKALGKIDELKRKGLPTEAAEREAGWAYQQELRARGMEEENRQIQDGQIWREREDVGAAQARAAMENGAKREQKLRKDGESYRNKQEASADGRMTPAGAIVAADLLTPDMPPPAAYAPETRMAVPVTDADFAQRAVAPQAADTADSNADAAVTTAAATTLSPEIQAQMDPANAGNVSEIVRENPTTPNSPWNELDPNAHGPSVMLPTDAQFVLGRPVQNDGELAYGLALAGEEAYNLEEARIAKKQNEIETEDENELTNDALRTQASMSDANAPFTQEAQTERAQEAQAAILQRDEESKEIKPPEPDMDPEEMEKKKKSAQYDPDLQPPELSPK